MLVCILGTLYQLNNTATDATLLHHIGLESSIGPSIGAQSVKEQPHTKQNISSTKFMN